jgi:hypothetical protein
MSNPLDPAIHQALSQNTPGSAIGPRRFAIGVLRTIAIGLLHLIVLALVVAAVAITSRRGLINHVATTVQLPSTPRNPLLIAAIALIMAHCSLSGIWWSRMRWPSHAKSLAAALSCFALWGLLLLILDESRGDAARAAGWAASLAAQCILAAVLSAMLELAVARRPFWSGTRFSILFLLLWTSVVAVVLGAGRVLATRFGWTPDNFFSWHYFWQLQTLAAANAIFAVVILASLRISSSWFGRSAACAAALIVMPAATVLAMRLLFENRVGVSIIELLWLSAIQGLFVAVTLVPLEIGRQSATHISK